MPLPAFVSIPPAPHLRGHGGTPQGLYVCIEEIQIQVKRAVMKEGLKKTSENQKALAL